ncbi:hypothetical protein A7E78_03840 [Syntrophotalea acetylenivorans]|uniref:Uncharacterized protein n=1 Tax=Syntrophotalea acetylenivorans TaxID=1842532 RepID=A0A1L3GM81_9BACT|nr:hypothetical protein [Syntrophotalea acetylenivorans]APG27039.1 hypothetical protein A7E78_03840 [Syntrophotalea acetylenivorans]
MSAFLDPRKNLLILGKLVCIAVTIFVGVFAFYHFTDQKGKDAINKLGVLKQAIPWEDRADTMTRLLIDRNKNKISKAILDISHPTGKEPILDKYTVSKLNNSILVEIMVDWKGGFLGSNYKTKVSWEFTEQEHKSTKVIFDTAPTRISQRNSETLNDYFRTKIYPVLISDMRT